MRSTGHWLVIFYVLLLSKCQSISFNHQGTPQSPSMECPIGLHKLSDTDKCDSPWKEITASSTPIFLLRHCSLLHPTFLWMRVASMLQHDSSHWRSSRGEGQSRKICIIRIPVRIIVTTGGKHFRSQLVGRNHQTKTENKQRTIILRKLQNKHLKNYQLILWGSFKLIRA